MRLAIALLAACVAGCLEKPTRTAEGASSETVIGRVLLPGGTPAQGVAYVLRDARFLPDPGGRPKLSAGLGSPDWSGRTDADGRYRIDSVGAGDFLIGFEGSEGRGLILPLSVAPPFGTRDLGERVLQVGGTLTGTVIPANADATGATYRSGYVRLYGLGKAASLDTSTGRFSIAAVPPGRYGLRVSASFPFRQTAEMDGIEVLAGKTVDIGELRLNRIATANFTSLVPDGLIAYWPCDEGAGAATVDPVGENDGVLRGVPLWSPGVTGSSLDLDGVDDHVSVPDLYLAGDFTIAAWVRLRGVLGNNQVLLGKEDSANLNFADSRFRLYSGRSGPGPDGTGSASTPWDPVIAKTLIKREVWTHVAITRRAGMLALFMDGREDATGSWADPFPFNRIGKGLKLMGDVRTTTHLEGNIDEVRVYDRALSAVEMSSLAEIVASP